MFDTLCITLKFENISEHLKCECRRIHFRGNLSVEIGGNFVICTEWFMGILTTTILEHGNEALTQRLPYLFVFSSKLPKNYRIYEIQ